jgi:hypothetical protein
VDLDAREKSLDRQIRAFQWVRALAGVPGRVAGSRAERLAADLVAEWLGEIGFDEVERLPIAPRPHPDLWQGLHLGLGALACALGGPLGALVAGLAWLSLRLDPGDGSRGASRWLGRTLGRALAGGGDGSVCVVARAGSAAPRQRIVVTAHVDCARPRGALAATAERRLPPWLRGTEGRRLAARGLLLAGAAVSAAAWLGAGGVLFAAARLALVAALGLAAGIALRAATAPPAADANDNASGVAALLTCAEQLLARLPPATELVVAATGARELGGAGLRAVCDAHSDWSRDATRFIAFADVGAGPLGWAPPAAAASAELTELARRVSASRAFGDLAPGAGRGADDVGAAAADGFPALAISGVAVGGDVPERVDPACVVRAADFGVAVARAALAGAAGPIVSV